MNSNGVLKLISALNMSLDAASGRTVFVGTTNSGENVSIGNPGGNVAINGTVTVNGNSLGAAVFT